MRVIFVASLPGVDRKNIINLSMQRANRRLEVLDFDEVEEGMRNLEKLESIEDIKECINSLYRKLEKRYISIVKTGSDVVISGYFLKKTRYGILPIISFRFFEVFDVDFMVILNQKEEFGKGNEHLSELNRKNMSFAELCSALSGSFMVNIDFNLNNMLPCINSLARILKG